MITYNSHGCSVRLELCVCAAEPSFHWSHTRQLCVSCMHSSVESCLFISWPPFKLDRQWNCGVWRICLVRTWVCWAPFLRPWADTVLTCYSVWGMSLLITPAFIQPGSTVWVTEVLPLAPWLTWTCSCARVSEHTSCQTAFRALPTSHTYSVCFLGHSMNYSSKWSDVNWHLEFLPCHPGTWHWNLVFSSRTRQGHITLISLVGTFDHEADCCCICLNN